MCAAKLYVVPWAHMSEHHQVFTEQRDVMASATMITESLIFCEVWCKCKRRLES